jgi:hypothetical protein
MVASMKEIKLLGIKDQDYVRLVFTQPNETIVVVEGRVQSHRGSDSSMELFFDVCSESEFNTYDGTLTSKDPKVNCRRIIGPVNPRVFLK